MKNQISTVSASRTSKLKRAGLNNIRIEPADNGFTVIARYDPAMTDKERGGLCYYGDRAELEDKTVHETVESVEEQVSAILSAGKKSKGGKEEPGERE